MHQRIPTRKESKTPFDSSQHSISSTPLPSLSPKLAVHNTPAFDLRKLLIFPPARPANPSLKATEPDDPEEQKAERKADQIMQMAPPQSDQLPSAYGASSELHGNDKDGGQPLDESTRAFMEARFGQRLNQVRIHTDRRAANAARSASALAYTVGNHIVFGQEQYAPTTHTGQRLLAHELAHVVSPSPRASIQRMFSRKKHLASGDDEEEKNKKKKLEETEAKEEEMPEANQPPEKERQSAAPQSVIENKETVAELQAPQQQGVQSGEPQPIVESKGPSGEQQLLKREGEEEPKSVPSVPVPVPVPQNLSPQEAEIKGFQPPYGQEHFKRRYFTQITDVSQEDQDLRELRIQDASGYQKVATMDPARQHLSHKKYNIPFYNSKINVENGIITVLGAYKNEDEEALGGGAAPFSETLFQQWIAAAQRAGKDVAHLPLNKVLIHHIREKQTERLILDIKNDLPGKDEDYSHTFSPGEKYFQAILNTRFGKAVRFLLEQHPHTIGHKHIASIELRARGSGQNTHDLAFNLA